LEKQKQDNEQLCAIQNRINKLKKAICVNESIDLNDLYSNLNEILNLIANYNEETYFNKKNMKK
jgi:hypothetical protein